MMQGQNHILSRGSGNNGAGNLGGAADNTDVSNSQQRS